MQRILDLRITKWYFKLVYVAGAWVVGYTVSAPLHAVNAPPLIWSLLDAAITLASFILGARIFRGKHEAVAQRRPWWKMTARRALSRSLGIIFLISVGLMLLLIIPAALGVEISVRAIERLTVVDVVINCVLSAVLAFLYVNSASRLPETPRPVQNQPTFKTRVKLD